MSRNVIFDDFSLIRFVNKSRGVLWRNEPGDEGKGWGL